MFPLVLLLASLVALSSIDIYAQDVHSKSEVSLGAIHFDHQSKSASFSATGADVVGTSLCLGTHDIPGQECFVYQEAADGKLGGSFQLFVDQNGIQRLSFSPSLEEFSAEIIEISHGAGPNMLPLFQEKTAQKPQTSTVVRKRVVTDEDGVESVVEEEVVEVIEEDNRSWVQKNWMYIVPPLVLFLLFAPVDEQKK